MAVSDCSLFTSAQLKPSKGTLPCLHSLLTPAGLSLLKSAPLKHAFPVSPPRTPPSPSPLLASVRDMITRGTLSGPEWDHTPSWRPHVRRAYTRYHAAVKDVAEEIVSASEFAREYHIFLESIAQPVQLFQLIMDDFENEFGPGATKGLLGVGQVGGPNLIQIMDFCAAKRASELLARVKDKVREKQEKDKKRRTLDDKQKRLDEIHAAERQLSAALDILVRNARGELGHSCDDCQHHLHDAYPNLLDPSQMTKTVKEVERKCELLQAEARKLERDIKAFTDEIIADNVKAVNGGPPAQKLKPASAESPRPATPAEDRPYFERPVGCSRDLSLRQQMEDPFSSIARRQARPCMQPSASAKSRGKAPAAPRVTQTNQALANSKGSTTLMQIEGLTTLDPKTGKLHTTTTSKTVPAPRQPSSKVTLPPASVPKQSVPAPPPAAVLAPEAPTHATIEAEEVLATEDVKEAAPAATEAPASTHTEETLAEEAIVEDADETLVDDPPEEELPPIVESAQAQKEPEPVESKHVNGHTNLTAPGMNSRSVSAATTVDSVAMQAQVDADQSTAPKKHKKHKKKKQGASKVAEAPVVANGTPSKLHGISAVAPDGLRLYTVEVALNRGRKWRPLREQVTEGVRKMLQAMPLLKTCSTAWCTREWTATPAAEPTTAWAQLDKLLLETFIAAFKYELIGNLVLPLSFVRDVVAKDYLLGGGRMTEASDNRTPRDVVPFLEAVEHTMWRTGTTFRVQFLLLETLTIAMQKLCDILRAQLGPDLCLCRVAKHPDVLVHAGTRLSQGEIADRSVPVDLPCMDQQAFIKWCHKQLRDKQLAGAEWEGVERSYRVADYLYTFANAFDASLDRMMAKVRLAVTSVLFGADERAQDPYTIAEDVFTLMEWHGGLRLFDLAMRLGREPPSLSDDIPDERAGWTLKTRVPGWATVLDLAQDARPEDRQIETTLWEDERKQVSGLPGTHTHTHTRARARTHADSALVRLRRGTCISRRASTTSRWRATKRRRSCARRTC